MLGDTSRGITAYLLQYALRSCMVRAINGNPLVGDVPLIVLFSDATGGINGRLNGRRPEESLLPRHSTRQPIFAPIVAQPSAVRHLRQGAAHKLQFIRRCRRTTWRSICVLAHASATAKVAHVPSASYDRSSTFHRWVQPRPWERSAHRLRRRRIAKGSCHLGVPPEG